MKFLRGRGECRGLGSPHAASFKLWGRADGSSQEFLLADFCFLKQNVACGYPGLLAMDLPGSIVVLPGWVILGGKGPGGCCLQSLDVLQGQPRRVLTGHTSGPPNVPCHEQTLKCCDLAMEESIMTF